MLLAKETVAPTIATKNTKNWPKEIRDNFEPLYGDDLQDLWDKYIEFCSVVLNYFPKGCWTNELQSIRVPFLIFQGDLVSGQLLIWAHLFDLDCD